MLRRIKGRWECLCAPLLFHTVDVLFTLSGQPEQYWANHKITSEMSPILRHLLEHSPSIYIMGVVAWAIAMAVCILLLPRSLSVCLAITFTIGHSVAVWGWLVYRYGFSYWTHLWYDPAVAATVFFVCQRHFYWYYNGPTRPST